jgi:hypothetical protein
MTIETLKAKEWLVQKDEQGRWYFHHGKYAPMLINEAPVEYLNQLIEFDMGHISLEARNFIAQNIKRRS